MSSVEGQLSESPVFELFRELGIDRRTGILELTDSETGKTDRFFFVSGELYLAPEHPLALAISSETSSSGVYPESGETSGQEDKPGEMWFSQAIFRLQGWNKGSFRFSEDLAGIPSDLVGPLPTFSIVMDGAVASADEFSLLKVLGGEEARLAAAPPSSAPASDRVELDNHDAFFLSRADHPVSVKDLLGQSELDRFEGLRRLCRLFAAGLICHEEDLPDARASALLSPGILEKFSRRIVEGLDRSPLKIDEEEHRRQIAGLLGRLGGMTYYELLGIGVGATSEEIHSAYSDLARVVHPSHTERLGLSGKEGGLELLFEKATEAYLTLNDRDRSRRYLRDIGSSADFHGRPSPENRRSEVERMADENYRRARMMMDRTDYHFAVELLLQAVRVHPKAEYYVLLGRCQAQNPKWLQKAIASYGRALQLDQGNTEIRLELARALEAARDLAGARREYQAVLQREVMNAEAEAGLERLQARSRMPGGEDSWIEKLKKRLPGKNE